MPDPTRLHGRDAQPLMPFDSLLEKRCAEASAHLSLLNRLIRQEIWTARTSVANRQAHIEWISQAWIVRRAYQKTVAEYRRLLAQQKAQEQLLMVAE